MELTTVHIWIAAILGDILLLAGVIALASRWIQSVIKVTLESRLDEVDGKIDGLTEKAEKLGKVQEKHTDQLEALNGTVARIVYQVQPNRGTSLRDAVTRTEKGLEAVDSKLDDVIVDVAILKSRCSKG